MRVLLGFLLAPLLGVIATIIISRFLPNPLHGPAAPMAAALYGYPAAAVLGIPSYFILKRLKIAQWWAYGFFGGLLGCLMVKLMVFFIVSLVRGTKSAFAVLLNFSGLLTHPYIQIGLADGAIIGLMFWIIVRPDKKPASRIHA